MEVERPIRRKLNQLQLHMVCNPTDRELEIIETTEDLLQIINELRGVHEDMRRVIRELNMKGWKLYTFETMIDDTYEAS